MITPCTTPAAPFYALDVRVLAFLESVGIDAPCNLIADGMALSIGLAFAGVVLILFSACRLHAAAIRARRLTARFDSLN